MVKYKISLKPLGEFYFGQEKYRYMKDGIEVEELNYNLKSAYYPQQTAILGMLRKEILKAKGHYRENFKDYLKHYDDNKETIDRLIGAKSFEFEGHQSFGLIKYISPLILAEGKNYYMAKPKNLVSNSNEEATERVTTIDLANFNPKEYNPAQLVKISEENGKYIFSKIIPFESTTLEEEGPYFKKNQVRIKRSKSGKTLEDSYFRQEYYILKPEYEFVFWAEFEEDVLTEQIVEVGGNSSLFKMKIDREVGEKDYLKIMEEVRQTINPYLASLLILSPTFLEQNEYEKIEAGFIDTIGFRNTWMERHKHQKSNKKYYLLDTGSIISSKKLQDIQEIQDKILSNKQLYNIGYNHVIR